MEKIYKHIDRLIDFGLANELIKQNDAIYSRNRILDILNIENYIESDKNYDIPKYPCTILDDIEQYAINNNIIEDLEYEKDNLRAKIMDVLVPKPSNVIEKFNSLKSISSTKATDYLYNLSQKSNYIQTDRIAKNINYTVDTKYGEFQISINLSKPEKNSKEIAMLKNLKNIKNISNYPKTPLAIENIGVSGTIKRAARQNIRIVDLNINNEIWHFQYSPYSYYNEHSILFSHEIRNMKIDKKCFKNLLDFLDEIPDYFIGSNADLPIVGGSILNHDHYQCGKHVFPMDIAKKRKTFIFKGFDNVEASILDWPLTVIRLNADKIHKEELLELSDKILKEWQNHDDYINDIKSHTNDEPHNTITPIARMNDGKYELDLVLRNNNTSKEKPFGIFHVDQKYFNIKQENLGLIEVMGLAILPSRLKKELEIVNNILVKSENILEAIEAISANDDAKKHADYIKEIFNNKFTKKDNYINDIYLEIGKSFASFLEYAGVYKRHEVGEKGLNEFLDKIKK